MYANGRQCAVDADVRDGEDAGVAAVHDVLPGGGGAAGGAGQGAGAGAGHGAARVSPELARDDLVRALRPLVTGYRKWLTEQAARVESDPEIAPVRAGRGAGAGSGARRWPTGWSGRSSCCGPTGSRGRRSGSRTRRWRCSACGSEVVRARLADPGADVAGLLRRAGRAGEPVAGGRSSSRSCCCACRG